MTVGSEELVDHQRHRAGSGSLRDRPDGKLVQNEVIDVPGPTMMHDFMITGKHAIFMDLPVVFDLEAALAGTMPFRWSDDYGARIGIMPRQGGNADEERTGGGKKFLRLLRYRVAVAA